MDDLFDIAHQDALTLITIPEDREFLIAQREKRRRGCMSGTDNKLHQKEQRRMDKDSNILKRQLVEETRSSQQESVILEDSSDEDSNTADTIPEASAKKIKTGKQSKARNIVTPELASVLDRNKISIRSATYVLAATVKAANLNPQDFAINRESIRRGRVKHREKRAAEIKSAFKPNVPLTVHWDGKMLPVSASSKELVDRCAILVSGDGVMKLLAVPALPVKVQAKHKPLQYMKL